MRLRLVGLVVVAAAVLCGAAALRNPGREVGPAEEAPLAPWREVALTVLPDGPAVPFDGTPLDVGDVVATGPVRRALAPGRALAGAQVALLPGTPEAGLAVAPAPGEEWRWVAGARGLRLVRRVGADEATLWAGAVPGAALADGVPVLALTLRAGTLEASVAGIPLLRATAPSLSSPPRSPVAWSLVSAPPPGARPTPVTSAVHVLPA